MPSKNCPLGNTEIPDGFPVSFFKSFLHIVCQLLMDIFSEKFARGLLSGDVMLSLIIAILSKGRDSYAVYICSRPVLLLPPLACGKQLS